MKQWMEMKLFDGSLDNLITIQSNEMLNKCNIKIEEQIADGHLVSIYFSKEELQNFINHLEYFKSLL